MVTSDESESVQSLVEQCLDRMESEGASAIERICAEHPAHATALRERLARLQTFDLLAAKPNDDERIPERLGEFRLIRRLGAGGMGVVYLARQESLGRDVALKVIRPDYLFFPKTRTRFRREVETVAKLQHPAIVPIHFVGDSDGTPYFAMEYLRGATLAQIVAELRERPPATLTGSDLARAVARVAADPEVDEAAAAATWLFAGSYGDACVRIVRQVAEALAHAHGRGVFHRDVKPSNVMVTPAGRVVLLDFGLASSEDASEITRSGSQIGSLPYSPPEIVRGELDQVDARSDVYSLGATLYELLALALPFSATDRVALAAAINSGRLPPIRARNAAVQRDAETVCQVAMSHAPANRYATAADFARDLGHVLERRPIEARRAGLLTRVARWIAREPAQAAVAALVLFVLIGTPSAVAWQQNSQRRSSRDALLRTLGVLNRMLGTIAELEADRGIDNAETRLRLEQEAHAIIQELPALGEEDPAIRRSRASTLLAMGRIETQIGKFGDALPLLGDAIGGFAARDGVVEAGDAVQIAEARQLVVSALVGERRFADAEREITTLLGSLGDAPELLPIRARARRERLLICHERGDRAGEIAAARAAIDAYIPALARRPDDLRLNAEHGGACRLLASALLAEGGLPEITAAEATLRAAIQRIERIERTDSQSEAELFRGIAILVRCQIRLGAVAAAFREAQSTYDNAASMEEWYAQRPIARLAAMEVRASFGAVLLAAGSSAEARAMLENAILKGRNELLVTDDPDTIGAGLVELLSALRDVALVQGRTFEAAELAAEVAPLAGQVPRSERDDGKARPRLVHWLPLLRCVIESDRGAVAPEIEQMLLAPGVSSFDRRVAAIAGFHIAWTVERKERHEAALRHFARAEELARRWIVEDGGDPAVLRETVEIRDWCSQVPWMAARLTELWKLASP
ncbi:MAG: serine/threonine protein kinase [Planctomycetes bacterium]|nr:serine/threonine protein kinase [Planctomycetota bacterium]